MNKLKDFGIGFAIGGIVTIFPMMFLPSMLSIVLPGVLLLIFLILRRTLIALGILLSCLLIFGLLAGADHFARQDFYKQAGAPTSEHR